MKLFHRKKKTEKAPKSYSEFSKWLLIQESALIWLMTVSFIVLAFICVIFQFFGELPWLTAMIGLPWTAYGVSQAFYYKKAQAENTKGGIKYENVLQEGECEDKPIDLDQQARG